MLWSYSSSLIQRCSPGLDLITFTKHSQSRGSLWNTPPTKLETQNRHSCGGGVIFAHSVSLGPSLVLHRSDAVTDAWLGAKLAL